MIHSLPATPFVPSPGRALGGLWFLQSRIFFNARYWLRTLGLLGLLALATASTTEATNFLNWVSGFYLKCLVPLAAFMLTAGVLRDDLQPGSGDYLFTRPIPRPVYLGLRYLTQTAALQIQFLLALCTVTAVGLFKGAPGLVWLLPSVLVAQALLLAVFSALGLLGAVVTRRYALLGLAYAALVEAGMGSVPTALNQIAMTRQVMKILEPALADPRLSKALAFVVSGRAWTALGILAATTLGALAVAALIFSRQERTGNAPEN
jgi:ABC-type transport system involved in multi-copper enzyme maturation permease subunit